MLIALLFFTGLSAPSEISLLAGNWYGTWTMTDTASGTETQGTVELALEKGGSFHARVFLSGNFTDGPWMEVVGEYELSENWLTFSANVAARPVRVRFWVDTLSAEECVLTRESQGGDIVVQLNPNR